MRQVAADYHVTLPDGRSCRLYLQFTPPLNLSYADLQEIARLVFDMEAAACN